MSSRNAFYVHAAVVMLGLAVGMSESYSWLRWAQTMIPLLSPLMLANLVLPLVVLNLASKERRSQAAMTAALVLSAALCMAFFLAVSPLCA